MEEDTAEGLKDAIRVDTTELRGHVDASGALERRRDANALLQTEAVAICEALQSRIQGIGVRDGGAPVGQLDREPALPTR